MSKIYIILILFLIIALLIIIYLKKNSIKNLVTQYTTKTSTEKMFLSMKKSMEKRFLGINHAPIILAIDFPTNLSFGNDVFSEEGNGYKYFINEQCVIVSCQIENCEEVVRALTSIFPKAFHTLCISISDYSDIHLKRIESIFFKLQSLAHLDIPVFLMYFINFERSVDKYGPFGFTIERYSRSQILEQLEKTQEDIFYAFSCDQRVFNRIPPAIFQINSLRENIEIAGDIFSENIRGVFFYDSSELLETVFQKIVYSRCSYAKSIGVLNSIRKNFFYFIKIIGNFLLISLVLRYSFLLFRKYKKISQLAPNVKKFESIRAETVAEFLRNSTVKYSPIVEVISSRDIEQIEIFQNKLLGVLVDEVKKREKQPGKTFYAQPTDTDTFFDLNKNVNETCRVYKIVKPFDRSGNYKQIFSEKIIFFFEEFFKNLENYRLFIHMSELGETLEKLLNQNVNVFDNTCKLRDIMMEVKRVQQSFLNKWIFDFNDEKYSTLLSNVRKVFGSQLIEHIERIKRQQLDLLSARIENCEFIGLEKVFEIKNNQIYLSSQFSNVLNTIIYILQNNQPEDIKRFPNKESFIFWDLEKINQAISLFHENQQISTNKNPLLEKISSLANFENIKTKLLNAQYNRESFTLSEMASNTSIAFDKIKNLFQDLQKEQQRDFYNEMVEIFKNNFNLIAEDFMKEVASILMIYKKLEKWENKDNLVFFIFNIQKDELNYTIEKIISRLIDLNNNILAPLIKNSSFFKNKMLMEYLYKQFISYEKGELNSLSATEALMKSLKEWQIKWRPLEEQTASSKEYIKYHYENFKNMLIIQTNKIFFEESKIIFNNLVKTFNQTLAGKFPFERDGKGSKVSLKDLALFSSLYQNQRERLMQDKTLMSISTAQDTIRKFNEIVDFFTLEGTNLFHSVYIQSHYKKDEDCKMKQDNLILKYTYSFGNQKYQKDDIDTRMYVKDTFSLNIKIADSSVYKISPIDSNNPLRRFTEDPNLNIKTDGTSIDFTFTNYFTFFRFVYAFQCVMRKEYVVLKILIPIEKKNNSTDKSEIITYIRIDNLPSFPNILFELK